MTVYINKSGPNGNAFAIMGVVDNILKQCGRDDRKEVMKNMRSGDYEHLCSVAIRETGGLIEFTDGPPDDGNTYL